MVRSRIGLPSLEPLLEALEAGASALLEAVLGPHVRSVALGCVVALSGCGPAARVEVEGVVRDGRTGAPIAGAEVSSDDGPTTHTDEDGRFTLDVSEGDARVITARAAGRCPTQQTIIAIPGRVAPQLTLHLHEAIALEVEHARVAPGGTVQLRARLACAPDDTPRWVQRSGPALEGYGMRGSDDGRTLTVTTHRVDELVQLDARLDLGPPTTGPEVDYVLELRASFGGEETVARAHVRSAPSTGHAHRRPAESEGDRFDGVARPRAAALDPGDDGRETAEPSASTYIPGHVTERSPACGAVAPGDGSQPTLHADPDQGARCGGAGCHASEDAGWARTAHARALTRGVDGSLEARVGGRCGACHAIGASAMGRERLRADGLRADGLRASGPRSAFDALDALDASVGADASAPLPRREGCATCHIQDRSQATERHGPAGGRYAVDVCARCHDVDAAGPLAAHAAPQVDEWRLSPMSDFARGLTADAPALRVECARCHSAQGFVAWRRRGTHEAPDAATAAPLTCATCHDPHRADTPRGLRVYDETDALSGGAQVDRMGRGALCATCHRAGDVWDGAADAAPHAPQTNLLLGVGARLVDEAPGGHRAIADTCTRCHMTRPADDDPLAGRVGGHTFSTRAPGELNLDALNPDALSPDALSPAACAPCHGDVPPDAIGAGDWDGDGRTGPIADEHDRALRRATAAFRSAVEELAITDACAAQGLAADVAERDARLVLVDADGRLLGDCDSDGAIGGDEVAVTIGRLPTALQARAYDLALVRADGSRGVHNPRFTFDVLDALTR